MNPSLDLCTKVAIEIQGLEKVENKIKNIRNSTVMLVLPVHATILCCRIIPGIVPTAVAIHKIRAYHNCIRLNKITTIELLTQLSVAINMPVAEAVAGF